MKKKRRVRWKRLAVVAGAFILVIALFVGLVSMLLSSCAGKKDNKTTDQTTEESKVQMVKMGDEKSGQTPVNIDNQTGQAIVSFKVKKADATDYGENLLGENRIKNNATAQWYFDPGSDTWDVEIKLANYNTFVLHDIPFDKFNGMVSIKYRDETGYLEFKPKNSETAISTYNDEVEIKNKEAKKEEQQSDQSGSNADTDTQQTEEPVYDDTTYDDGSYDDTYDYDYGYDYGYDDGSYDESYDYDYGYEDYSE